MVEYSYYWLTGIGVIVGLISLLFISHARGLIGMFTALIGLFLTMWGEYEAIRAGETFYQGLGTVGVVINGLAVFIAFLILILNYFGVKKRSSIWRT